MIMHDAARRIRSPQHRGTLALFGMLLILHINIRGQHDRTLSRKDTDMICMRNQVYSRVKEPQGVGDW
jgi:hypothetical protein